MECALNGGYRGPIEVASENVEGGEDRMVDQVICELARWWGHFMRPTGFGSKVYEVNDSVILTSGRSTPTQRETVQRGKGVALVLIGLALVAWRCGGKQWKAWSSRCVSA